MRKEFRCYLIPCGNSDVSIRSYMHDFKMHDFVGHEGACNKINLTPGSYRTTINLCIVKSKFNFHFQEKICHIT